jgi:hypothetical protein
VVSDQLAVAERLDPIEISANQYPAPDPGRMHRVIIAIQAHVVKPR